MPLLLSSSSKTSWEWAITYCCDSSSVSNKPFFLIATYYIACNEHIVFVGDNFVVKGVFVEWRPRRVECVWGSCTMRVYGRNANKKQFVYYIHLTKWRFYSLLHELRWCVVGEQALWIIYDQVLRIVDCTTQSSCILSWKKKTVHISFTSRGLLHIAAPLCLPRLQFLLNFSRRRFERHRENWRSSCLVLHNDFFGCWHQPSAYRLLGGSRRGVSPMTTGIVNDGAVVIHGCIGCG